MYYVSEVFKSSSKDKECDNPNLGERKFKYNTYLHLVTYDK